MRDLSRAGQQREVLEALVRLLDNADMLGPRGAVWAAVTGRQRTEDSGLTRQRQTNDGIHSKKDYTGSLTRVTARSSVDKRLVHSL